MVQRRHVWALVIAPRRAIANELLSTLRHAGRLAGVSVEYRSGPNALIPPKSKAVYLITAKHLLESFYQSGSPTTISGIDLVVCESLEQLSPSYELAVSLLRHATQSSSTRFIGISNSLNDPNDLADWLAVDSYALHSLKPSDRDQSLAVNVSTISIPYSSTFMKTLAKPVYGVIKDAETAIVFVPSRGHCHTVALNLLTQSALEVGLTRGFLPSTVYNDGFDVFLHRFQNSLYHDFVSKGVGFFHNGVEREEQNAMLQLFAEGVLRVLIVPRDACWSIPVRAEVVVVMGCQYLQPGSGGADRQVHDYELTKVAHMQGRAVRQFGTGAFYLFCQPEAKDTYTRFLNDGLPLESSLLESQELEAWFRTRSKTSSFNEEQAVDALSFSYLARRIKSNPSYYDCTPTDDLENLTRLVDALFTKIRVAES